MTVKQRYAQAMEWLYIACIAVSGITLVAITLMIPVGVFMRYVMNSPLSWPEPASVVLMVMFSFIGGAAAFRAHVHVAVMALKNAVGPKVETATGSRAQFTNAERKGHSAGGPPMNARGTVSYMFENLPSLPSD